MDRAFHKNKLLFIDSGHNDQSATELSGVGSLGLGRVGVLPTTLRFTLEEHTDGVTRLSLWSCRTPSVSIIISVDIVLESCISRKG